MVLRFERHWDPVARRCARAEELKVNLGASGGRRGKKVDSRKTVASLNEDVRGA